MSEERTVISVFLTTYKKLLERKLAEQNKLKKEITWDEFFTNLLNK